MRDMLIKTIAPGVMAIGPANAGATGFISEALALVVKHGASDLCSVYVRKLNEHFMPRKGDMDAFCYPYDRAVGIAVRHCAEATP